MSGAEPRPSSVKRLLREFGIKPRKRLGQNFLVSQALLKRIIAAAELADQDAVLEIGAGLGTLTRRLAQRAGRVIALELDERLIPLLHDQLASYTHVQIVHGDILSLELADVISTPYKVVANLPYYITSAILRHLLESEHKPALMVVTVQNEVAERLVAGPGAMSLLAVSVQFYGQPRIVARAPPGAFYPSPRVQSAVVRIDPYVERPTTVDDVETFFRIVRAGFSQRRKQLRNSLSQGLNLPVDEVVEALHRCGIDEKQRPQELSVGQWAQLYGELAQGALR
ncbi:MAG: ribosomal RNA small subunit methyltransferase A [Anaerolineae bacterium]|nr:ribosomal RNA small subunit methyltransferase A [Anaerolineae bacterium]NIO00116.1 ribosomal RNA small subunit methyltransferase A [Anaerolineae bacterium]NIQ82887.1 ribosomal RNA small subunit methyltransferase A [Anaerolineae bacterium]